MKQTIYSHPDAATLLAEREFNGPLELVWKAWTDADILAEWWAPLPFKAVTKSMDFRNGGRWHYYMLGPDGSQFWCMVNYSGIENLKKFNAGDYFCNEEGEINPELPGSDWLVEFSGSGNQTRVQVTVRFPRAGDKERIMEMGFQDGFRMAHENLDKWLEANAAL